ncbi:MAG: twin-arginine translocase TatA/TatE family subunit [Daejeonella sp.]
MNIGGPEMILIFLVVLLLFGGKKLPELARGLGKGLREFKDASDGIKREIHNNINTVSDATADMDRAEERTEDSDSDPIDKDVTLGTEIPENSEIKAPKKANKKSSKIAH